MIRNYTISTDKKRLDINLITHFLNNVSYWAKDRSKEVIEKSIVNSLCFGVFDENNKQVGFARVITDYAVFAWILDVFIIKEHQGKGLGKLLMHEIISHNDLCELKKWGLATKDAHGLYEKFGFKTLSNPETMMERINV